MDKAPDAFRTISEVAEWLGVQPHVLRFWESKFPQIKPVKRAGGRRYYRPSDMRLLGGLKKLLHEDGLTIKGAQKVLREQGVQAVQGMAPPIDEDTFETAPSEDGAQATGQAAGTLPPEDAPQPVIAADAPELSIPDAAIPTPSKPSFADVLEETDGDAAPEADPAPEDPQGRLDLPLVRRRARPVEETAAPVATDPSAPRPPKSERAARTPPPATLFDDLAGPDTPADPPSEAPAAEDTTAPAKLPQFRSRLGGMVATEAVAQGKTGAPADATAPSRAPVSLPPADMPLDSALSMLQPGDVPAIRLRPIYDQMVALRARMDAAG